MDRKRDRTADRRQDGQHGSCHGGKLCRNRRRRGKVTVIQENSASMADILRAYGGYGAAGIGGGYGGNGGEFHLYNGTVIAYGNCDASFYGGAGIGSGAKAGINDWQTNVNIYGGEVSAHGSYKAAGIGGGGGAGSQTIFIKGGTVEAFGGKDGPGVGSGQANNGPASFIMEGGSLYAVGQDGGVGIGGGYLSNGFSASAIKGGHIIAVAGGKAERAFGHGQEDPLSTNNWDGSMTFEQYMLVKAGTSNYDAALVTSQKNDDKKAACQNKKYVEIYPCEHPDVKYTNIDADQHKWKCDICGTEQNEKHIWDDHGDCVCGAHAAALTVRFLPGGWQRSQRKTGSLRGSAGRSLSG